MRGAISFGALMERMSISAYICSSDKRCIWLFSLGRQKRCSKDIVTNEVGGGLAEFRLRLFKRHDDIICEGDSKRWPLKDMSINLQNTAYIIQQYLKVYVTQVV